MKVRFTKHAQEKFAVLKRHGLKVSKKQVIDTVQHPARIDYSRLPLLIAQGGFDKTRVLRVVYKTEQNAILVITFYPGRKSQYEN